MLQTNADIITLLNLAIIHWPGSLHKKWGIGESSIFQIKIDVRKPCRDLHWLNLTGLSKSLSVDEKIFLAICYWRAGQLCGMWCSFSTWQVEAGQQGRPNTDKLWHYCCRQDLANGRHAWEQLENRGYCCWAASVASSRAGRADQVVTWCVTRCWQGGFPNRRLQRMQFVRYSISLLPQPYINKGPWERITLHYPTGSSDLLSQATEFLRNSCCSGLV